MRYLLAGCFAAATLSACAQAQPPAVAAPAAVQDMEPDVTRQVQALLAQAAGTGLAPDALTDNARAALDAARLQQIGAALKACGALPALELLERRTKGEDRMYVYRAPCAGKPLLVDIDFNKGGRVNRLVVRPQ